MQSPFAEPVASVAVADSAPESALVERVRAALERGALVALPTETVYGLAARADDARAVARLAALKGGPSEKAFTWHVGTSAVLSRFDALVPLLARLAERYWPGPLTLVARGVPSGLAGVAREGWTGVRFPAHRATAGILAALPFPVVMSSANLHGTPPLLVAADVQRTFGRELALVVDGGPARLGEASGVLSVGPGRFELLREGLSSLAALRRAAGLAIGFVCTGNTCRSPMAEAFAQSVLGARLGLSTGEPDGARRLSDFGFRVESMGILARPGEPASALALEALGARGLTLAGHAAQAATLERVRELDRVYALTRGHLHALRSLLPPGSTPMLELLDPEGLDIPDPAGGSREDYARCAERIEAAIRARAPLWA